MNSQPEPQPAHIPGVIPYVGVVGAKAASEFYQKAFDAREVARMEAQDGERLMHCHLEINGGAFFLCDVFPEHGYGFEPTRSTMMHLQLPEVQAAWDRAIGAGCEAKVPIQKMFWGDRYGQLVDPFGVVWSMGGPDHD